ncbi:uncharacterized protein [Aegilops tauschii subsp. strangulata]|uniref:uncharacterized protein n=1 Tax=Aegilops tauschii subsp. strangulata TaxID=200361 RepID=UPI000989AC04|nr:uncharacterized protein LOC109756495 [Aegilops tauschii subsp. strangulata]
MAEPLPLPLPPPPPPIASAATPAAEHLLPPPPHPNALATSTTDMPPPPLTLTTHPNDELTPAVAPPPSTFFDLPYVKAGQVALRCFLGCGNAMGLEFEDDCNRYLRLDITTPELHLASPLYVVFDFSNRHLDTIVVAALLQAALGGCAADFFVAMCSPLIFRFHVASPRVAEIILDQSKVCHRNYAFAFARTLPPLPSTAASCMSLARLLQIPEDLGLQFEAVAWSQLRSYVTVDPGRHPHGCRMYARVIQFSFTLSATSMALVLARLFGGCYLHFNTTNDGDSCFSFTVASPAVAKLIASMGDFRKRGMLLRFPWPMRTSAARSSLPGDAMPPSYESASPSSSPVVSASLPSASSPLDLPKVRRKRPGFSFFYRMLNATCFNQTPPHVHYTHHSHPFWIAFLPISVRPNEMLIESALNHCFSVKQDFHAIKVIDLIFKSGISTRPAKFQILKLWPLDFVGFRLFLFDQLETAVSHCARFLHCYNTFAFSPLPPRSESVLGPFIYPASTTSPPGRSAMQASLAHACTMMIVRPLLTHHISQKIRTLRTTLRMRAKPVLQQKKNPVSLSVPNLDAPHDPSRQIRAPPRRPLSPHVPPLRPQRCRILHRELMNLRGHARCQALARRCRTPLLLLPRI